MRIVEEFPHEVREIPHVSIPMPDGTKLAARIWLPEGAEESPVPAILEYIPYRKRDMTAGRDSRNHPYFAGHGYAAIRVDLRGSGDSEGVLTDEYLEQELADGEAILAWIAERPWCSGKVGIMGISWGGFNGLQLAARRPPELAAVISVCSTDDRYADDVHYMGGCLLGDNLSWAAAMYAHTSLPPDPALVGDVWRGLWMDRMRRSGFWLKAWLDHQRRDDYWKHGSICEDYSQVEVPVMAVSGWADGYSNSVFRLLSKLEGPRLGLVGPWSHKYPHMGVPGPAIGFLQECVRFWDHWLKGVDNGIDREPMLRAWMQDHVQPTTYYEFRPGRWVGEESWPSPHIREQTFSLSQRCLVSATDSHAAETNTIQSPLSVGLFAGKWCSFSATPDLPHDQREEDGGALFFDSPPLDEHLEIMGAPAVELEVASSRPVAMVAVRLSCVAPDDRATRVTYGLLNLSHRNSHEHPEPLQEGKVYRVRVPMNEVAQTFPKGHRVRLSISTSYWPIAWPPPEPARLTIELQGSALVLPVREPRPDDDQLIRFQEPECATPMRRSVIRARHYDWLVTRDLARDISRLQVVKDEGRYRLNAIDLEIENKTTETYQYKENDFTSVRGETESSYRLQRGDWNVATETRTQLTCDAENFFLQADIDAYEEDRRIYCRTDTWTIPRDLM